MLATENEAAQITQKPLGKGTELACKNTRRSQISSFYDHYHANYGRVSMLFKT